MPDPDLTYETTDIAASPAAAAETVVAVLGGVNTRWQNQQIKLSGWVNVTPDASATAVVLRVRRHAIGGALVGIAQAQGLGASAVGSLIGGATADFANADAPTAVPADGASHNVPCLIAAPPAWMDNAGNVIATGLYLCYTTIVEVGVIATPGQAVRVVGPFGAAEVMQVDGLAALGQCSNVDIAAAAAADLPFPIVSRVTAQVDATCSFTGQITVVQIASVAGAGSGGLTPADAVTDVVDSPGSLASGTYVLTAQMTGAAGASTVNGVRLEARVD